MFLLPDASAQEMSAVHATLRIPDGTPIKLHLAENVSSTHARVEDNLDFAVVQDVNVGSFTVIPAGFCEMMISRNNPCTAVQAVMRPGSLPCHW